MSVPQTIALVSAAFVMGVVAGIMVVIWILDKIDEDRFG